MSNHTPGPWECRLINNFGDERIFAATDTIVYEGNCNKADYRLIAAAPELLEALEALDPYLDAIVCYASTMSEYEPNRFVAKARAAIAKARGEAS